MSTASVSQNRTSELKKHANELVKQYIEYDGNSRPTTIYTARTDAPNGEACERTRYEYLTPTSSRVSKRKEDIAFWDATWDI